MARPVTRNGCLSQTKKSGVIFLDLKSSKPLAAVGGGSGSIKALRTPKMLSTAGLLLRVPVALGHPDAGTLQGVSPCPRLLGE